MTAPVAPTPERLIRFDAFEVDVRTGELRKAGVKVRLAEQPFSVLALLLAQPGEVVTRDELQQKLWPRDTFVALRSRPEQGDAQTWLPVHWRRASVIDGAERFARSAFWANASLALVGGSAGRRPGRTRPVRRQHLVGLKRGQEAHGC